MNAPESADQQLSLLEEQAVPEDDRVRVCVADEDELFLAGCAHLLASAPEIQLVGSSQTRYSAEELGLLFNTGPQVLILGVDTLHPAVLESLASTRQGPRVTGVLLLINEVGEGAADGLRSFIPQWPAGVGCAFKRPIESSRRLLSLVESVAEGRVSADASILSKLLGRDSEAGRLGQLSERETGVLELMASGLTNAGIGERLHVEVKTVERHINSIYAKIGEQTESTHPRVQAVTAYLSAMTKDA